LWPHSYNSHDKYLLNWEGELWADPDGVPSLVQELALLQLRSLLGVGSQASLALEEVAEAAVLSSELHPEDAEERP